MGVKTIVGVWLCTVAVTAMAAFSSPVQTTGSDKEVLTKAESTMCSALEVLNTCE